MLQLARRAELAYAGETARTTKSRLFRSCRQVLLQEPVPQRIQMRPGDAVAPVRVFHKLKLLVQIDQPVDHSLGALKMDVVVARSVNDQELALQSFGVTD